MGKLIDSLFNISYIEELARRDNWLNRTNPLAKFLVTIAFILSVTSVSKYGLNQLILYFIYPIFILSAVDIPLRPLLQKMVVPMFMGASLGMLNPILDQNTLWISSSIGISAGWVSFLVLFLKSVLCIIAALILISTTPIEEVAGTLEYLHFPKLMIVQFLLMFRYITVLVDEFERALTAYSMRSGGESSLTANVWGSFIGQIFIRSSERSIRLYESMKLRGFNGDFRRGKAKKIDFLDGMYLAGWSAIFGFLFLVRSNI